MSIIARTSPTVKPTAHRRSSKSKAFSCSIISLTVAINDVRYSVDQTDPGECGTKSFRLTKHSAKDGGTYDVLRTHAGIVSCDCPDYVSRHEGNGYGMCKHGRCLTELGLLAAPIAPVVKEARVPMIVRNTTPDGPLTPVIAPLKPLPDPMADAWVAAHPYKNELAPIIPPSVETITASEPCCELGEPMPCQACVPPSPEPVADPKRSSLFPETSEEVHPTPIGDDDHLLNVEEVDPADAWHAPFSVSEPYEPSDADRADAAEMFGAMEAQAHLDRSEHMTLAELTERQIAFYESWNNSTGSMFADALTKLLMQIRLTSASCPAELDARVDAMECDARETWQAAGYEEGRRVGAGIDCFA